MKDKRIENKSLVGMVMRYDDPNSKEFLIARIVGPGDSPDGESCYRMETLASNYSWAQTGEVHQWKLTNFKEVRDYEG